jgi:hypothetical protein
MRSTFSKQSALSTTLVKFSTRQHPNVCYVNVLTSKSGSLAGLYSLSDLTGSVYRLLPINRRTHA